MKLLRWMWHFDLFALPNMRRRTDILNTGFVAALALLLSSFFLWGFSNQPLQKGKLKVIVKSKHKLNGKVMMSLVGSGEDWGEDLAGKYYYFPMKNGTGSMVIENLSPDKYGIKLFVDLNANDEMDYNLIGLPKEPYAFSNNAMGLVGMPDFKAAGFSVVESGMAVQTIHLRND